ncbi:MAG: D-amino-acid transaminase [Bradyrhizobium sp.]|nr:MAG: D-amino-acid transaminase [Bradyrhizobium sp.]
MSRIAYVNGRYLPLAAAGVSIQDRAFQFGDGVYEVCLVREGRLIDEARHLARLERSLAALRIAAPLGESALRVILREVVARNRVSDGLVYLQVSRGAARRDHAFPSAGVRPGLVVTAKSLDPRAGEESAAKGVAVITLPDERWAHPDIKSLQLLPNVLAKQAARQAGAFEAWFVDRNGFVTEGSSTNAWIVGPAGVLITRQADQAILRGVTRTTLLDIVASEGLALEERPFSLAEAYGAREAFLSSATAIATPVISIDGRGIGSGRPGPVARGLRAKFAAAAAQS